MAGDPWWMIALRVLALAGMGWGAYEGFRRQRADRKAKRDAGAEPPSPANKEGLNGSRGSERDG